MFLMHSSSALCSGNLLLHINSIAGVTWLIAWEKVGLYVQCVCTQSGKKNGEYPFKTELNTNKPFAHSHSKCTLSSLIINYSQPEKILRGAFALPPFPPYVTPMNLLTSICVYFICKFQNVPYNNQHFQLEIIEMQSNVQHFT